MMIPKSVYCIIVTYNGMKWIEKCLDCLTKSQQSLTIIIIDNGSTDGTVSFIEKTFKKVRLIKTGKNLGFGQGNNIGLKIALDEKADHIMLINQDAYIETNTISQLVEQQTIFPEYGILSPVHLNGNGSNLDDHFFFYLQKSGIQYLLYNYLLKKNINETIIDTPFVNAAAWLISRECLIKTGGFDAIFFHYGEDDNYAQRVIYKGLKTGIYTGAIVYHDNDRNTANQVLNIEKKIKKEWIILLNHFCNINEPGFRLVIFKRLARHVFSMFPAMISLKKDALKYHYALAKNIVTHYRNICESRSISMQANETPHL